MIGQLLCAVFAVCGATEPAGAPSWRQTAVHAVPLVARWEGLETTAYLDRIASPPVWTICYGETQGVRPGEVRTRAECEDGLRTGLHRYWQGYRAEVQDPRVLRPQSDAAFTSLTWNIGEGAIRRSTAMRRINAGDVAGACEALTWWNRAGQRVIRGLQNRRADEYRLCMEGAG
ncbi:lysozyme [Roseibacterium sp. SDUM158017]|uniref:lysozyme n=1 Tax=Roseicyclus salinarum TaxID=3036773 RepID=UPI002414EA05|nr:lysozyme [Roseibacterium sp. SDUM158017]MDG4650133.1 lysozyme [Roseibacterium sp. SDUM158017]